MARLFVAIELSRETRAAIVEAQRELARVLRPLGPGAELRLVRPEHLHLTLVFIGDVESSRVDAIARAMRDDIDLGPFRLELAGCGVFPPRGRARVLWMGVRGGATELATLVDLVSGRLRDLQRAQDSRPFTPHLTLGRWREGRGPAGPLRLPDAGLFVVSVTSVTLFESRLLPGGPEHTPLVQGRLSGRVASLH